MVYQLAYSRVKRCNCEPGKVGVHHDSSGNPTMWQDVSNSGQAFYSFRFPYPGETGQRKTSAVSKTCDGGYAVPDPGIGSGKR